MTVVAITQEGRGRAYRFETRRDALFHPIVQYGDAIFSDEYDLCDEYRLDELPGLLRRLTGNPHSIAESIEARVAALRDTGRVTRLIRNALVEDGTARDALSALTAAAAAPPDDPATIVAVIAEDRRATLKERVMPETETTAPVAKEPKTPKPPKEVKDKLIAGLPVTTRITFGVAPDTKEPDTKDKDGKVVPGKVVPGKQYDADKNNPKRAGGKSAARFSNYKKNMTIAQAIDAGVTPADIKHDLGKGFIVVVQPKAA